MKSRSIAAAAAIVLGLSAPTLAASTITATDPDAVLEVLVDLGYKAKFEKTESGRPRIMTKVSGSTTTIDFYDCDKKMKQCQTLLFANGLDLTDGTTIDKANEWNSQKIYGRVYIDGEDDPWLEMTIVTSDGISAELFDYNLSIWDAQLGEFKKFFDF